MLHLLHTNDIGRYILGWSADRKLTSTLFPILSIILNKRTYTNKRDCKKGQMENTVWIEISTSGASKSMGSELIFQILLGIQEL